MPRNQKGFAHIILILVLLAAIAIGIYLVGIQTNLFPKAAFFETLSGPISGPIYSPNPQASPSPAPSCQNQATNFIPVISCSGGYRIAVYQCSDNYTGLLGGFTSCQSETAFKSEADAICAGRITCSVPSPTPQITLTATHFACESGGYTGGYLAWQTPANSSISSLAIQSTDNTSTLSNLINVQDNIANGSTQTWFLVPDGQTRYYRVAAKNSTGGILTTSPWTNVVNVTCTQPAPSPSPSPSPTPFSLGTFDALIGDYLFQLYGNPPSVTCKIGKNCDYNYTVKIINNIGNIRDNYILYSLKVSPNTFYNYYATIGNSRTELRGGPYLNENPINTKGSSENAAILLWAPQQVGTYKASFGVQSARNCNPSASTLTCESYGAPSNLFLTINVVN